MVEVGELIIVDQLDLALLDIDRLKIDALIGFLHLI